MPAPKVLAWTQNQFDVLNAIFLGQQTHEEISEKFHITSRTLRNWLAHPDFQARLDALRADFIGELRQRGTLYLDKGQRIVALAEKARSASDEYEAHPLLREIRPLPVFTKARKATDGEDGENKPDDFPVIINEHFNREAFDAFRGALDDIAKELGHRKQQVEHSGELDVTTRAVIVLPEIEPDDDPAKEE